MNNEPLLSQGGIWFLVIYLASLILIGFAGKAASKEETLKDFYLGGKGFGVGVLFLTMYATQYSGNSLIGFAGSAYRNGWFFLVSVSFMIAIVAGYLLYAPKLYNISKKHDFITIGDYINFRYNSKLLTYIIVAISIFALSNYMLTNLKAIGYIMEYATGGGIGFTEGIIFMAIVMVIYETLGVGFTLLFLLTSLPSKPFGFHAGVIGLLLNFSVVYTHHRYKTSSC